MSNPGIDFYEVLDCLETTERTFDFINMMNGCRDYGSPPFGSIYLQDLQDEALQSVECFNQILHAIGGIPVRLSAIDGPAAQGIITGSKTFEDGYWHFWFKERLTNNQMTVRGTAAELRQRYEAARDLAS